MFTKNRKQFNLDILNVCLKKVKKLSVYMKAYISFTNISTKCVHVYIQHVSNFAKLTLIYK